MEEREIGGSVSAFSAGSSKRGKVMLLSMVLIYVAARKDRFIWQTPLIVVYRGIVMMMIKYNKRELT